MHHQPVHEQSACCVRVPARDHRHPRPHQGRLCGGRERAEGRGRGELESAPLLPGWQEGGQTFRGSMLGKHTDIYAITIFDKVLPNNSKFIYVIFTLATLFHSALFVCFTCFANALVESKIFG